MKRNWCCLALVALLAAFPRLALSQVTIGTPPFGTFTSGPDVIDLANLNVHWTFPIISKAGRGIPFNYKLTFDNSMWQLFTDCCGNTFWFASGAGVWGWQQAGAPLTGYVTYSTTQQFCGNVYSNWVYYDPAGTPHNFPNFYINSWGCGSPNGATGLAGDGSGYQLTANANFYVAVQTKSGDLILPPLRDPNANGTFSITDRNGNTISTTKNGSQTTFTETTCTSPCTAGATALTIDSTNPMAVTYTYAAPGGNRAVTVNYQSFTVATNFGIPGIGEWGGYPNNYPINLVSSIVYPDGSSYSFTYEPTPSTPASGACTPLAGTYPNNCVTGRLARVVLPTGGSIGYRYYDPAGAASFNGIFDDGTTSGFYRDVYDGALTNSSLFYRPTQAGIGNSYHGITDIVDPQNNETDLTFSRAYETQRLIYQGRPGSGGTLLKTVVNCYNGVWPSGSPPGPYDWTPCINANVTAPITTKVIYPALPNGTTQFFKWSAVVNTYNTNGLTTESDEYDWTTGAANPPVRKTSTTYATNLGNIVDHPSSMIVYDGSNNPVAQTSYAYDEYTQYPLVSTANNSPAVPQHNAPPQNQRGNLTTVSQCSAFSAGSCANWLSKHFAYFDTGTLSTATDVNGAVTTYNYPASDPNITSCGYTFPTSVTAPIATLVSYSSWNCTGGVATQTKDANTPPATTNIAYNDPNFWRQTSVTDPLNNVTNTGYGGATITETNMLFNSGKSLVDSANTLDGLGRPHFSQRRQGTTDPALNTFDSVETDYDSNGRPSLTTIGYVGGGTQTYCSAHNLPPNCTPIGTSTSYDALDRPTQLTDPGGGTTTYSYAQNDVLITLGPAPTGENTKQRQYEYDALGRLTSVCELTSAANGGGACGQANPLTGYLTRYTYDLLGNLTGVTQNAQSGTQQTRSFTYDRLSRMTSEQNPETGTISYTYDADTSCSVTNTGDMVKRRDTAGNNICYYHDGLHRLTDVGTPNGCKRFRYDNSTGVLGSIPTGVTISSPMGRMVEAETDTCASPVTSSSLITDEWFSYSARGELTDVYESTPHSGGYYDVKQSYWEHGAPKQLSNLPGLPAITYGGTIGTTVGLDGEGRVTQVTTGTGVNPTPNVNYNNADPSTSNEPVGALLSVSLGVNAGLFDSDSFVYDKNTGRPTQYTFNVNSQTDIGQLAWNANGSLQQLQITDGLPGPLDTQTCNYTHDDLGRIATVNCGWKWYQSFSYDPFGNIKKAMQQDTPGTPFQPTYDTTNNTNRVASLPNGSVSYDANGDIATFTDQVNVAHTYTWDAEGRMLSHTSMGSPVNLIYDAMGRMVEQVPGTDANCTTASDCTQIVYGPGGDKLALMHGQTLSKAFVPLPGGATAVYNSSGLAYYRHSDWLGSSRLATTPSHCIYYSGAYAPYGESYAEYWNAACNRTTDRSFTGQNEDTVPGMADFMYREYSSAQQSRWISPDPAGLAAVDPMNPQSWNRYAYVSNNPLARVDLLGLDDAATNNATPCTINGYEGLCIFVQGQGFNSVPAGTLTSFSFSPVFTQYGFLWDAMFNRPHTAPPPPPPPPSDTAQWWKDFGKALVTDWGFHVIRKDGESIGDCANHAQQDLLGATGSKILNAAAPISAAGSVFTQPFRLRFPMPESMGVDEYLLTEAKNITARITTNVSGIVARSAISEGTVSADAALAVESGSMTASRFIAPATAVAVGLKGGFLAACVF